MNATIENKNETAVTLAEAIAAHRFAANMKPEHLNRLAEAAMSKQFSPGENIFTEGEPANRFYLICQGRIALESRGDGESPPLVQFIGEDEVLGWSWLFPPYYWHFSARAIEPTNAIFFYGTRLRAQCEEDPVFGYELMKRIASIVIKRLQITRVQLIQLQQESSKGFVRLRKFLSRHSWLRPRGARIAPNGAASDIRVFCSHDNKFC